MTDLNEVTHERLRKLRKLQLKEIELIRKFIEICERENLLYFMLGGTMLGAIRHKGFIPWDDDADFGMPRPDYEKFLLIAPENLPEHMMLETVYTEKNHTNYFSRVSLLKEKIFVRRGAHGNTERIWVDIFPLDGMPNNGILRQIHKLRLLEKRLAYQYAQFNSGVFHNNIDRVWYEQLLFYIGKYFPVEKLFSKMTTWIQLDNALKKYPYEQSDYLVNFMGAYKFREMFSKDVFGDGAFYDFEGMKLRGAQDYDFYLTQLYGDYTILPPKSERNHHFTEFIEEE